MLLLTDGTVMCQQSCSNQWWEISPDPTGSYIQGSWTPIAPSTQCAALLCLCRACRWTRIVAGGEYKQLRPPPIS